LVAAEFRLASWLTVGGRKPQDRGEDTMDIYVGNLPYQASEQDLRQLFEPYGDVAAVRVVTDKFSGQSKGFAFVEMPNRPEALQAIEKLNGTDLQGRSLRVNESQPRPRTGDRGRGGYGGDR